LVVPTVGNWAEKMVSMSAVQKAFQSADGLAAMKAAVSDWRKVGAKDNLMVGR
jgi:hypothetical protein